VSAPRTPIPNVALGEIAREAGFRRVSRGPEPLALARLRALLLEVAGGGPDRLREALEGFQSWRALATLCGTEWAAGARRSTAAARRLLQRRLRALSVAPVSAKVASALPIGAAVHVTGTIRPVHATGFATGSEGGLTSHIWSHSAMYTHNVRLAAEEGHDFFLTDEEGQTVRVIVARGHLINADELLPGDRVSVFGFTDRVASAGAGPDAASLERDPLLTAIRAGDDLPLLIRRLRRPRLPREG
jgi:hypothetical protein